MCGRLSDNITRVVEQVSREVERGKKRPAITLTLPSGLPLRMVVGVRKQLLRYTWEVALIPRESVPCGLCCSDIASLRSAGASASELSRLLYRAVEVVSSCDCTASRGERFSEEASGAARPSLPPRRINILSQESSASGGTDAAPQALTGLIKIKPASPDTSLSQGAANAVEVRGSAPSFVYSLASGVVVGVTLISHACELMIRHCSESNRHGREVGGVLVGYSFEVEAVHGARSIQSVTTDIIPITSSDSSGAHLCLSEQDWLYVQRLFDTKYTAQGKVRIGWYHTHPTQKVFFSGMDVDTHTVFRQPHQFALVIDPQKMEAGLFYWKDYERQLLAGPLRFMLEARGEATHGRMSTLGSPTGEQPRRAALSPQRFGLFILAALLCLIPKVTSGQPLTLSDINLAVLGLFAGLRLWNGDFFHPEPPRMNGSRSGLAGVRVIWAASASALRDWFRERSVGTLLTLLLGLTLSGGTLYLLFQHNTSTNGGRQNAVEAQRRAQEQIQEVSRDDALLQQLTLTLFMADKITRRKEIRTFTSESPAAKVTYMATPPQDGRVRWEVAGRFQDEKAFFQSVFGLSISSEVSTTEQKDFQSALGVADADGLWGAKTRAAFVNKASEFCDSGEMLVFRSGTAEARVKFMPEESQRATTEQR
jgi:proteasome lid subunit RPN8/RPN11